MKEVYIVFYRNLRSHEIIVSSAFKYREDAEDYVNKWNEWEKSEDGQNDLWFFTPVEYYETRVEK